MRYLQEYNAQQKLSVNLDEAWDFFTSPQNLALITPPEMKFRILSGALKKEIHEGMEIDYRVRPVFGIPMRWKTRICRIEDRKSFTDIQLKGPYSIWEHTHTFVMLPDGILMKDVIRYKIPLGFFGNWLNTIFIRKRIEHIFLYRREAIEKIFRT